MAHKGTKKGWKSYMKWLLGIVLALLGFILYCNIRIDRYAGGKAVR